MKRLLVICIVFVSATNSFCQISKSVWMINGEIGYQNLKEDGASESISLITFNPKAGYFLTNSLMVGADFNIISAKSGEVTYTQSLVGPFVRFYAGMSEGGSVAVFGEGSYGFGSDKSKYQGESDSDNKTAWSLGAGIAAFVGENVSIEPLIKYQSTTTKYEATQYSSGSESKVGSLEFLIGLSIYLGKRGE